REGRPTSPRALTRLRKFFFAAIAEALRYATPSAAPILDAFLLWIFFSRACGARLVPQQHARYFAALERLADRLGLAFFQPGKTGAIHRLVAFLHPLGERIGAAEKVLGDAVADGAQAFARFGFAVEGADLDRPVAARLAVFLPAFLGAFFDVFLHGLFRLGFRHGRRDRNAGASGSNFRALRGFPRLRLERG